MSTHGMQRDPCCVFPADGKTVTKDLFELKAVADGVYAAIAAPQYKINSNAAVILTNDGVIVVDSHSKPSAARALFQEIRGVTKQPVHKMVRDYFYVKDAANAYRVAAIKLLEEPSRIGGEAFNFSNDQPLTVLEITRKILAIMGKEHLEPVILNQTRGEIPAQCLSSKKAQAVLGWTSTYSLEEGLRETVDFIRQNL